MKVFLDMVGCRLNQSELESYACQFRLAGHSLTSDPGEADLVVINTCTVTASAASDSRQKIRQAGRLAPGEIIVTGCWSTINPAEASSFPRVRQVIHNAEKDQLVSSVLNIPAQDLLHRTIQREPIPGSRLRTRAHIKVQDGCDNHCTYCITTLARGNGKSLSIEAVLDDIRSALEGGVQEIVLTGVHLGSWGHDFERSTALPKLVQAILAQTDIPRLRLSSLEPWDITPDYFELWQDPRICRHLHLPLQSGCEATLKRMGRRITPAGYASLVQQARAAISDVAITTDIITGFPGESQAESLQSETFVRQMSFVRGHVFTYSARPGTPACLLPGQVPQPEARLRNARMREIIQASAMEYRKKHLGHKAKVLWEKATPIDADQWELTGLTDNYLRVKAISPIPCRNQIMDVNLTAIEGDYLAGEVVSNGS